MTQHSKQDTSWWVPMTTLFLIALWVMRASLGVLNTLHYFFPCERYKQQRYRTINSSLSYRLSRSTGFLFLNDRLKMTGDDSLQGLGSDSSLVGYDTSLETNSVSRTGTDCWSHNWGTDISISQASFGLLSWALIKWPVWTYLVLYPVFTK